MNVDTEFHARDTVTIQVSGEVDMNTSDELREVMMSAVNQGVTRMTVDLGGVEFMDSSGIATLVEALQALNERNGELILTNLRQNVRSVFEIANLLDVFTVE